MPNGRKGFSIGFADLANKCNLKEIEKCAVIARAI
jgi:hypothetical protein